MKADTKEKMAVTIGFLRDALMASDIGGSRGKLDIFADRLVRACSVEALPRAMETLLRTISASADKLYAPTAAKMIALANSADAPRAMRWLPDKNGARVVRTRPPYWNIVDAVPCCEVGAVVEGRW